ncbi:MAG TPA: AIR synthase-related protein, partial [Chroococcales cyanobacterium]
RITWLAKWNGRGFKFWAERQFQPGVTDNLAHTVEEALEMAGLNGIKVASGSGHVFALETVKSQMADRSNRTGFTTEADAARFIELTSRYHLYHPLTDIFCVHDLADSLANGQTNARTRLLGFPAVHLPEAARPEVIDLDLTDQQLDQLSKSRLLALTLAEMKTIVEHFKNDAVRQARAAKNLPPMPLDVELEILAQTWSEHCKHKIFNATINHTFENLAGKKSETIKSLYKTYIQAPTRQLMKERDDLLSVFEDNSGVVKFNDQWAVCFKVETHNSPSALEPYGGALTGILGVNRDILGTGLGAKPIFNTDIFCFAYPSDQLPQRPKLLPAETILNGVRKGVEDGGNKSGIPTVNGAIFFDNGYRAKPLVFCGTGGILPLDVNGLKGYEKHVQVGDRVVVAGGRVGKDGIHGATFSSEKLHEGSPQSAVQIGDPFTQKRLLDFVVEARDLGLITGITDNGAGGLSSSVGEMARLTGGATIELAQIPRKYPGLTDWEIVVSESQERMTIATRQFDKLSELAAKHKVEVTDIGQFTDHQHFEITNQGKVVAYLPLDFLHDGLPAMQLEAESHESQITMSTGPMPSDFKAILLDLLSHPNICSRRDVIQRYDHEVQGMSVVKPLMGATQLAACDASVIAPVYSDKKGVVVSNGLCPRLSEHDAYVMAVSAVDEAVRNAVCVGADPGTIT